MARYKLVKIPCMSVAGVVIQPDEKGEAEISKEVTDSPDFVRLLGELRDGAAIEYVGEARPDQPDEKGDRPAKKKTKADEKAEA